MIQLTKRVEFCAAHQYVNLAWSTEENQRVFGKEGNLHGHNYVLEVTIRGNPSPETGMVMDLKALKTLIVEAVVDRFDHKHLNQDVQSRPFPVTIVIHLSCSTSCSRLSASPISDLGFGIFLLHLASQCRSDVAIQLDQPVYRLKIAFESLPHHLRGAYRCQ